MNTKPTRMSHVTRHLPPTDCFTQVLCGYNLASQEPKPRAWKSSTWSEAGTPARDISYYGFDTIAVLECSSEVFPTAVKPYTMTYCILHVSTRSFDTCDSWRTQNLSFRSIVSVRQSDQRARLDSRAPGHRQGLVGSARSRLGDQRVGPEPQLGGEGRQTKGHLSAAEPTITNAE
jgi:hypothetical protein